MEINGICIVTGLGKGEVLFTRESISFWGCVNPVTARISDKRHELYGQSIKDKILAFPYGKGSSTGSLMILELLRLNLAPAAIINIRTEPLLASGPVVGKHFYGKSFPIVMISEADMILFRDASFATVKAEQNRSRINFEKK